MAAVIDPPASEEGCIHLNGGKADLRRVHLVPNAPVFDVIYASACLGDVPDDLLGVADVPPSPAVVGQCFGYVADAVKGVDALYRRT